MVLFKWVYHAPLALSILKNKLMFPLITIFEKRVREVLKKFSDTAKKEELSNIFRRSILEKCNFEDNLSEYLSKKFPGTLSSERQLQQEEESSQLGYMDYTQPQPVRPSSNTSALEAFNLTVSPRTNNVAIPRLNLPNMPPKDSHGNTSIVSRSTRRNELINKSANVSASHRLSNPFGTDMFGSREPSGRNRRVSVVNNEANMSYLEEATEVGSIAKIEVSSG